MSKIYILNSTDIETTDLVLYIGIGIILIIAVAFFLSLLFKEKEKPQEIIYNYDENIKNTYTAQNIKFLRIKNDLSYTKFSEEIFKIIETKFINENIKHKDYKVIYNEKLNSYKVKLYNIENSSEKVKYELLQTIAAYFNITTHELIYKPLNQEYKESIIKNTNED